MNIDDEYPEEIPKAKITGVGMVVNGTAVGWTMDMSSCGPNSAGITIRTGKETLYGGYTIQELTDIAEEYKRKALS